MTEEQEGNAEVAVEPPNEKLWTKKNAFLLLSITYANFLLGTCFSLPAPFFPREAELKGASPTVYGLIFGSYQLVNLITSPLFGKMMPHLVPRFVMIAGIFVAGSCSIVFGCLEFSPPGITYIALCFCVRITESIAVTAYTTTCFGIIPVMFPKHMATVLSTTQTIFSFGMIAGPTVGGALYQIGGYYLPFVVLGGCLMLGTIFTSITFSGQSNPPKQETGSMLAMISSPSIVIDVLVFAMGPICVGFNDATLEPHLRPFNLSSAVLGSMFIINGGIFAFVSPVYGYLIDKGVNPYLLCIFGCTLCFVAYLIIGPVPFLPFKTSVPTVVVALVLLGFGLGAQNMSAFFHGMKDITRRGFPDNVSTYALYTGVVMAFSSLGAFAGPSVGGYLLEHIGYAKATYVVIALEGVLIVIVSGHLASQFFVCKKTANYPVHENDASGNGQNKEASEIRLGVIEL